MTSRDPGAMWNLVRANLRLSFAQYRSDWPPTVFFFGDLLPNLLRMVVYVLICKVAAGEAGMDFAYVGCVVLALASACISYVSDIPVGDVDQRVYHEVRRGSLPPLVQYAVRTVPFVLVGVLESACAVLLLGVISGNWHLMARTAACLPMLAVAAPWAALFGLVAIAPAIGNMYQNLVHNFASALVTVTSGAMFPTTVSPALDAVAQVMPLHHLTDAVRAAVAGRPWGDELLLEVAVGVGWVLAGVVVFAYFDVRGRRVGRGAFAA